MPDPKFQNIQACVFDAYGTLFDFNSAVAQHRARLGDVADRFSALWRAKQLEYTWLRSLMRQHADFWRVTQDALDYTLDTFDLRDDALRGDLINAYLNLDCYPDVVPTLEILKRAGLHIAILSNGSPMMLDAAVKSARIETLIDLVLSVEAVGVYKPDPRVYQLAVEQLGVRADAISFQSANAWDAVGAVNAGLRVVWINRFAQRRERLPFAPDAEIASLRALPEIIGV
ncbi:MAG: haloacid dehalogenase type II [Chloroflexi bacterium]|nr:haloacid dehalogenase type II [Chloroflexota bacterium]